MKYSEEMTIKELNEKIEEEKQRLKILEQQDESNFTDFDIAIKGKKVNMELVNNHIIYFKRLIEKKLNEGLSRFTGGG